MNYRLYSFVAGLYLSDLQKGLQTAHVVSEISDLALSAFEENDEGKIQKYRAWAANDKTIIICSAMNHKGVVDCWTEIERTNSALGLPAAIFREDEQSMNGMATACGVIVPEMYWAAVPEKDAAGVVVAWVYTNEDFTIVKRYPMSHAEGQFINHIKQYRLA